MRITRLSIKNFRCFDNFATDLAGKSRFLIGENAIGKSSLITAIARALARDRAFHRYDFFDLAQIIDIQVTLTELDTTQLGIFAEVADFGGSPSLTIGVKVVWDPDGEECEVTHGYPT